MPVAPQAQGSGEIQVKELAEFQAATTVYQGESNIMPAYNQLYKWLHAQGFRDAGSPLEIYLGMPGEELRAEVYVPIVKAVKSAAKKPAKKKVAKTPAKKKVNRAQK